MGFTIFIRLTICICLAAGFNLDSKVPILRRGIKDSYFGFSVAQHFVKEGAQHVVLVGAPRDNGISAQFVRTGAVYRCPLLKQNDNCSRLDVAKLELGKGKEDKSDQWLGVSVASSNSVNGKAIACAHRYRETGHKVVWGDGICFRLDNDLTELEALEPCKAHIVNDTQCQAGTSSTIDENGRILVGSPGSNEWRGNVFKIVDPSRGDGFSRGHSYGTRIGSYLGMSVRIGARIFEDRRPAFIAGAPRSKDFGEVLVFQENGTHLTVAQRIRGPKIFSGFGYEILVGDFNGDRKDDLIVGAPFFTEPGVSGAIFIYFNTPEWKLSSTSIVIKSRKMKDDECKQLNCHDARFGFSLANIGDLNKDGVDDFVVGAPFEGNGAVYVFLGSKSSKIGSYSQRIAADDVVGATLKSFGYSLSGGGDIDGNSYPDLVIGSYQSDTITVLRARPVLYIIAKLESTPKQIDPKVTNCSDGKSLNCLRIKVCLKMKTREKDRFGEAVNLSCQLEAEKFTGASFARVYLGDNQDSYFTNDSVLLSSLGNGTPVCNEHTFYLKSNNKDFYNAIAFRLTCQLPDSRPPYATPDGSPPDFYSYPVLNASRASKELQVPFIKFCGNDDTCNSDMTLSVNVLLPKVNDEYELDLASDSQLAVNVSVVNSGEDAHSAVLRVTLPPNLSLIRILPNDFSCIPVENDLECELGNPISSGQTVSIQMVLDPRKLDNSQSSIRIGFAVNTTSAEKDITDDLISVEIKVSTVIDLTVFGSSDPTSAYFSIAERQDSLITHEEQIGQEILHKFEVRNIGGTKVSKSLLVITWPFRKVTDTNDSYILYIMEKPMAQENGAQCYVEDRYINPQNINVSVKAKNQESSVKFPQTRAEQIDRHRYRRSTVENPGIGNLFCGESSGIECASISCRVHELPSSASVLIEIRARLWNRTMAAHFVDESELWATSTARIAADVVPGSNIRERNSTNDFARASTKVIQSNPSAPVATWIIVLSVLVGILLLIIIAIVLWRVGFFKRTIPKYYPNHSAEIIKANEADDEQPEDHDSK